MSDNHKSKAQHHCSKEGIVIDIIYVGELEIHTVLTYHCTTFSLWPGPLPIVLHMGLTAKPSDTADIHSVLHNFKVSQFSSLSMTAALDTCQ